MARRASIGASLGAVAALVACSSESAPPDDRAHPGGDAAARGGHAGTSPRPDASTAGSGGSAGVAGSSGAAGCNANRAPGIPIGAGTMSADVDSQALSGGATILWAAGSNTLSLKAPDGSVLAVVFPGCEAKSFSVPTPAGPEDAIALRFTASTGEEWACAYEDTALGPAHCVVDVTAYGDQPRAPVTGTFSGVLRLKTGTGPGTKAVSAGTFTFERP